MKNYLTDWEVDQLLTWLEDLQKDSGKYSWAERCMVVMVMKKIKGYLDENNNS